MKLQQEGHQHRVYFTEPAYRERLLLGLLYAVKTGDAEEREQQSEDIRRAEAFRLFGITIASIEFDHPTSPADGTPRPHP
jgi:hypothetical protein